MTDKRKNTQTYVAQKYMHNGDQLKKMPIKLLSCAETAALDILLILFPHTAIRLASVTDEA